ncbi:hypothetical protein N0V90_005154 [Kalmusia sp. IMI 367209]|nr:hypothetical protein N0V90_005154 [Kalmusia sp. IMI 367209]
MSTFIPSEGGAVLPQASRNYGQPLPNADLIPRSAKQASGADSHLGTYGYSNVNIDIPLDTQSSLSMELTHGGKVMELVARFESFPGYEDSDASQAHQRERSYSSSTILPDESDTETVRASPIPVRGANDIISPHSDRSTYSPRKPIPSSWKITQPRAPVFQTDIRKEEREKRKAIQESSPTQKALRGARSSVDLQKSRMEGATTYLTKEAIETFESDITASSGPYSPKKVQRRHSKASPQGPASSPARCSPRQKATIQINISPTRTARLNVQDQEREPSVISNQTSEYHSAHSPVSLGPSEALSRRSSRDTFYSPNSFHTAEELLDREPSFLSLIGADGVEQTAKSQGTVASQSISHSRSKTESSAKLPTATGQRKLIRPAVPNLTLRIPQSGVGSSNRRPQFTLGSATSSGSGSPVSPTKSSSRIPRISSTFDASTKASTLKRSQSAKVLVDSKGGTQKGISKDTRGAHEPRDKRHNEFNNKEDVRPRKIPLPETPIVVPLPRHVRTIDSLGNTPILSENRSTKIKEQHDVRAMVTSYLNDVDPNARPDHTPFTEDVAHEKKNDLADTVTKMLSESRDLKERVVTATEPTSKGSSSEHASRITSTSTVKAIDPEECVLKDPAIVYSGKKIEPSGKDYLVFKAHSLPRCTSQGETDVALPRSYLLSIGTTSIETEYADALLVPPTDSAIESSSEPQKDESRSRSRQSKHRFDLRATAPEFIPRQQAVLQPVAQNPTATQWMQPYYPNLMFDPFSLDRYGMPWFYHMYPVYMKQVPKSFKKGRTFPRTRKRGDTSTSPNKSVRPALANEERTLGGSHEKSASSEKPTIPFASQLEEIARSTATRDDTDAQSPTRRGYSTLPPRSGRPLRSIGNGLYNSFGRGGFHPIGMPIEATTPFPDPIPPSGRKEYVGYTTGNVPEGCGVIDIDRAAEWGGRACNKCEPNH